MPARGVRLQGCRGHPNPAPQTETPMEDPNETLLDVQGMTCGSCVRHVRSALLQVDGVEAVDVKMSEGKVRVRHDADDAPVPRLVEALAEAGYPATPAE